MMYNAADMRADSLDDVRELALDARKNIDKIYVHWTAGRYGQAFDDYHICVDADGSIYIMCDFLEQRLAHTWRRNSRAVGVAMMCCYNADAGAGYNTNFKDYPPTQAQIESTAQVLAALCSCLNVSTNAIMTHCEAAIEDGYGPNSNDPDTRWDCWYLPDLPLTDKLLPGGDVLRGKAEFYLYTHSAQVGKKWEN